MVLDFLEDIVKLDYMIVSNIVADRTKVLMDTRRVFVEYARLRFLLLVLHELLTLVDNRACFVFHVLEVLESCCLLVFLFLSGLLERLCLLLVF